MKVCIKCDRHLGLSEFPKRAEGKDGHRNDCKDCRSKMDKNNYYKNREARRNQQKEYYDSNFENISEQKMEYRKNNLGKILARNMKRYCAKKQRTPKWLTKEQLAEIEWFYTTAKELQWLSEEILEVDHIIPLQGKIMSGLHVPWNLQILPKSINQSKGNRVK